MDEPTEVITSPPETPPEVTESPRAAARRDPQWVIDGCREARVLIEWAAEMGFKAADQEFAPILFCGIYTQDSRLLHSLGGFDRVFPHSLDELILRVAHYAYSRAYDLDIPGIPWILTQ